MQSSTVPMNIPCEFQLSARFFFSFFFNFLFGLDILRSGRGHFLKILFTHLFLYFRIWPKIKIRLDRRRRLGVGGRRQSSSRMDQSAAKVEWNIIIQGVH